MKNSAQEENLTLLEEQAIKAAVDRIWDRAIDLNQKILKLKADNLPALNRLGKAFWEKDKLANAKKTFQKVLSLDPYNNIASKNLKRLGDQKKKNNQKKPFEKPTLGDIFVEEPGKTKIVKLVRLADSSVLSVVDSADEVFLTPKNRTISVNNYQGDYLGSIPDDLSFRLLRLLKGGNQYQSFVKLADRQNLEIIIREVKRAAKFEDQLSFGPQG